MAYRNKFSLPLFFSHLLLLFSSKICRATNNHGCPPSSCGSIQNISYPFRLKDDPKYCGDPSYELVCENNRTIVHLNSKRLFVQSITYHNFTIRVVDPGLAEYRGSSSCPIHYLTNYDMPLYEIDYLNRRSGSSMTYLLIYVSCSSHLNTTLYYETAFCDDDKNILSNSPLSAQQKYSYAYFGEFLRLGEIEDSCSVRRSTLVSFNAPAVANSPIFLNYSYGFELLWFRVHCRRCEDGGGYCYPNMETSSVVCEKYCYFWRASSILKAKCLKEFSHGVLEYCNRHYKNALRLTGEILGARFFVGILFLFALLVYTMRRRHLSTYENIENFLQVQNNLVPIRYTYAQVKRMTNNFRDKLGEGGYGTVSKGKLRSGSLVAVKMLGKSKASGEEFISEVATIGRIHHVNVVNLIGFCFEGSKRALIYEFMPNGSLEKYIFPQEGEMKSSSWENMFKISLGVAHGIDYLHRGCDMQILHFDIKPHNILLDENFTPKISDFGLAKLYPTDNSIVSLTAARGTMGYMAPELFYKNIGRVSFKADDVYSFGMLLMEMAGKRKNLNPFVDHLSQIYFPSWVHDQFSGGKEIEMGDVTEDERKIVKKMILVALWCIQIKPTDRPSMNRVVEMLEGDLDLLEMPPKPFLSPQEMQDDQKMPLKPFPSPQEIQDDQDHEIDKNNAELPLLSTSYGDSGSLEIEM